MVSKIRELCKQNKTSIAALERQLGFGNGVIGRWDKSVPNYDRLCAVANALGVSVAELTGETDASSAKKLPATPGGEVSEKMQKMFDFAESGTPEEIDDVLQYIEFLKSKRGN